MPAGVKEFPLQPLVVTYHLCDEQRSDRFSIKETNALPEAGSRQEAGCSVVFEDQRRGFRGHPVLVRPLRETSRAGKLNLEVSDKAHGSKPVGHGWCTDRRSDEALGAWS